MRLNKLLLPVLLACPGVLQAAELKVLSAGIGELGLRQVIPAYERASGDHVTVQFAVPKALKQRVLGGEAADVLIAPAAVIDAVVAGGKAQGAPQPFGQVGVGVVVRQGEPRPAIATVEQVKQAALGASAVIYNKASTGLYLDKLFEQLGITAQLAAKVARYDDGDAVMRQIIAAAPGTIGFGAIAEIRLYTGQGADYVGPLPAAIQNYTRYQALRLNGSAAAAALLRFLGAAPARQAFAASGVEPIAAP